MARIESEEIRLPSAGTVAEKRKYAQTCVEDAFNGFAEEQLNPEQFLVALASVSIGRSTIMTTVDHPFTMLAWLTLASLEGLVQEGIVDAKTQSMLIEVLGLIAELEQEHESRKDA